jgi:hypothetical protein
MKITWNTDVDAPCAGEILAEDGRSVLVQTDWDYPGTANTFGWDMRAAQQEDRRENPCEHDGTDGTVPCRACGLTATDFISAAYDWLRANDGATAEDPGYFEEQS